MSVEGRSTQRSTIAVLSFALALAPAVASAQEHIFEPGTKHICVPAKDHRGWDCGSAEKPPAPAAKPDGPELRKARAADLDEQERAAAAMITDPPPAPAAAPSSEPPAAVAAPPSRNQRNLPNYLLSPEAAAEPQPVAASEPAPEPAKPAPETPKPVAEAPKPEPEAPKPIAETPKPAPEAPKPVAEVPKPEAAKPVVETPAPAPPAVIAAPEPAPVAQAPAPQAPAEPAPKPVIEAAPPPMPTPAEPPVAKAPEPPPAVAEPPPRATSNATLRDADAFRTLADSRWVLELARGSDRASVEASASQAALPRGQVYLLTLQRDGASWYVALWGDFDSIDSARAARGEALASGFGDTGWPRRVGPLKQELRLVR